MRDDRGETLLELLVAVAVMGIALVAVVGGLAVSVLVSDTHRKQATSGASVRDYAEAVEATVAAGGYVACASPATYAGYAAPAGYARSVVRVDHWNGSAWQSACPAADRGLQRLTLQVASDDGRAVERLVVVLRKPCGTGDAPCA
ncbi:prepilin-type N-terminal cleavage/methylation domain-containing protein [Actinokineospora soli]